MLKVRRQETGEVSFGLLAGGLVIAMVLVVAVVVRTQGNDQANKVSSATTTILAAVSSNTTPDVARLAPTTVTADPALSATGAGDSTVSPGDTVTPGNGDQLVAAATTTGLATPQAAVRNLWDAWRDIDRPRALLYATPPVVALIFDTLWTPQIHEAGCTLIESGWLCRFEGLITRWDLNIEGDEVAGYRVRKATIGEAIGNLVPPENLPTASSPPIPPQTRVDGTPFGPLGPSLPPTTFASGPDGLGPVGSGPVGSGPVGLGPDGSIATSDPPTTSKGDIPTTKVAKQKKSTKPAVSSQSQAKTTRVPATRVVAEPDPVTEPAADPTPKPDAPTATAGNGPPKPVPVANPE